MQRAMFMFAVLFLTCTLSVFSLEDDYLLSMDRPSGFSKFDAQRSELNTAAGKKIQKTFLSESPDAVIIISIVDTGFTEENEAGMLEALEYALMEYSSYTIITKGQRRINGYLFLTSRYTFLQDGIPLFADVFLSHIGTKQINIQILADSKERLDKNDLRKAVESFTLLQKRFSYSER